MPPPSGRGGVPAVPSSRVLRQLVADNPFLAESECTVLFLETPREGAFSLAWESG